MSHGSKKEELRGKMRTARGGLSSDEKCRMARQMAFHVTASRAYSNADDIMFFASFRNEIDTWNLIRRSLRVGKRVYLPRTREHAREIEVVKVEIKGDEVVDLKDGYRGIREPRGKPVPADGLDLVFVPGLAFDRAGYRIGYGGGFYDRFLVSLPNEVITGGLGYSFQVVEEVPAQEHDVPVEQIFTDAGIIRARR